MARKDVFISATSGDLGSYREVAKQALLDIGAHPVEQKNFPTTHLELQQMLARVLDPCDAVLHIAGFRYGAEPEPEPDQPRRSHAQWEYHRALDARKPLYVFLANKDCQFDPSEPEDAERQRMQGEHRARLKKDKRVHYPFSNKAQLSELIHKCGELRALVRPSLPHLPFRPLGEKFTGRRAMLQQLEKELAAGNASALSQPQVIHADGGVGKTALSVELGWRLYQAGRFRFVLFLNASAPETLDSELAALCGERVFGLPEREDREQAIRRAAVLGWLANPHNAEQTLLILDSADSPEAREAVRVLLPKVPHCAVLITSRHAWRGLSSRELKLFTGEEARDYFAAHLDPALLAYPGAEADLKSIAYQIDHLPLALELVVSYLHDTRQTPKEWLAEWQRTPAATLDYHDPDAISYPVSLSRVWDKSVARLSPLARDFLFIFASLAPRPAALPIGPIQEPENWPTVRAAFAELAKASLISWPAGRDELSIHRMLQACLRHGMSAQEREGSLEWALKVLDTSLPSPEYEEAGWRLWERLEPHIQVLLPNLRALHKGKQAQHLIFQYANWLYCRARHRDAEPLYRRALELAEERLGFEDPELAAELSGLSQVLHALNRMEQAEIVCRRALALLEKTSGDHPTLPYCLNTLANIFLSTDRVAEAEPLFRRALSLFEKSLGTDDPITLTCMHNLATVLAATERRPEASLLLHRALAILEKSLGPKHPQVAASLNELGELARAAGCFAEAEPLYRRAINILEESYGREHPHVASCLNNLALTLAELNQPVEARELLERALTIDFKIHGAEHPKVSNRLKNLAWLLLRQMGETEETVTRELAQIIEKVNRETQGSS